MVDMVKQAYAHTCTLTILSHRHLILLSKFNTGRTRQIHYRSAL